MSVSIRPIGEPDKDELVKVIREVLNDLEDQLNQRAQIYVSTTGRIPTNLNRNDLLVVVYKDKMSILVRQAKSYLSLSADMIGGMLSQGMTFKGHQTNTVAPTIANFPNKGDFGFFTETTTPTYYYCANLNGLFKKVAMT